MNDKRLATMIERMTAPTTRPQRDPAQLVALAKKGYGPALAVLKVRAERCPQHRAALDGLLREAGVAAAPAPATAPAKPAAAPVKRPAAAAPKPAEPVTCTPGEFRKMSGYDRGTFIAAGGIIEAEKMTRARFDKLTPTLQMKFIKAGGILTD